MIFQRALCFLGERKTNYGILSKDMIRPQPRSRALVHRHILRIQILVERNLIYLINQDWKKESKKEGTIRLGEECCCGNGIGRACSLLFVVMPSYEGI